MRTVIHASTAQALAGKFDAWKRCQETGNDYAVNHLQRINEIMRDILPSGSGWDNATTFDFDHSTPEKLRMFGQYHHMDDGGGYAGWTEHTITVSASLVFGLDIRISGRNRNDIKEYLHDLFHHCLSRRLEETYDDETSTSTYRLID